MKPPVFDPAWNEEVARLHEHDMREMWDPDIAPHIYRQYQYMLDFYFSFIADGPPLDILDIGCAQATLALLLAERGHRVSAVDIRPEFLQYAKSRHTHGDIRFLAGNLFEQNFIEECFDLVFANQIIEHVLDPEEKLRKLAGYLRPGGRLVVTTPNGEYLSNDLPSYRTFVSEARAYQENTADGDGHVFAFTLDELGGHVKAAGLHIQSCGWLETPLVTGHMKFRHAINLIPPGFAAKADAALRMLPWLGKKMSHQLYVVATLHET